MKKQLEIFCYRIRYYLIFFLAAVISIGGCQENSIQERNNDQYIEFSTGHFTSKEFLTGEFLNLDDHIGESRDFILIEDRFLVYNGLLDGFQCHLYDLEKKVISHFAKDGRGPGELLTAFSFDFRNSDRSIWVQDIKMKSWKGYSIDSLINGKNKEAYFAQIKFEAEGAQYPIWLSSEKIVSVSNLDAKGRFFFYNKKGELEETIGRIPPEYEKGLVDYVHAQIHQGMLAASPDKNNLVFSTRYSDKLEIYSLSEKNSLLLKGPEKVEPIWELLDLEGNQNFMINEKTIEGNTQVVTTNTGFYLLFSGKSKSMAPKEELSPAMWRSLSNKVLQLDWAGRPIKFYELDTEVINIAISSDGKYLYAIDYVKPDIIKYELL